MSRITFCSVPVLTMAVLLAAAAPVLAAASGPGGQRSYVTGNFVFSLGGAQCGFLKSMDGGAISAEVINEPAGPSYFVKKHIGQPKYEDVTLQVGFSMTKSIYEWIAASWAMNYQRKDCSITACDYNLTPKSTREFYQCLITETTIPACDGSSKEPAYMTLTLAPEYTRQVAPPAGKVTGEFGKNEQKAWLPSNFLLQIDGLNCQRVSKIDSFTIKQAVVADNIGDARDQQKEPGKLEFPNLRITLPEADAQTWTDWHKSFVIDGNNDELKEKSGTLVFLSPNRQTQLAKVTFHNLGIFRLEPAKAEANSDQIKRVVAELYCERMTLEYTNKVIGGTGGGGGTTAATRSESTATETASSTQPGKTSEVSRPGGLRVTAGEAAAKVGSFCQTGEAQLRLDSYAYTEFPKVDLQPGPNSRCLAFDFTLRNGTNAVLDYAQLELKPGLTMSDGSQVNWNGYLLSTQGSDSTELAVGADAKLRVFFEVPKGDTVHATKFRFQIGDGKAYTFDVAPTGGTRRIAA